MSETNVEIVRASIAAFRHGNLEAALKDFDRDVAFRPNPSCPENCPMLGRDAARSFLADILATFGTVSQVHTLRQGKVVMLEYFLDHEEALEAARLSK